MNRKSDELRRLLDELKVEHFDGTETTLWGYESTGLNTGTYRFAADETSGGSMQVRMFNITPEQAIAATLGAGECDIELRESGWGGYTRHCGACGADLDCDTRNRQNYCPKCGKKVKR